MNDSILAWSRRGFLGTGLGMAATVWTNAGAVTADDRVRWNADPFTLGVASGAPRPDGVVLWTRLAPVPLQQDGGLPPRDLPIRWQVAEDERFTRVVRKGEATARAEEIHSVHVDVRGLRPDRWYFYRFRCGEAISRTGRTRTLPTLSAGVSEARLAIASCQRYEHGYYSAYRHLAEQSPDLVVHLGDYIYENVRTGVRLHDIPVELRTDANDLASYRLRHTLYRLDPDLQDAHACAPWLLIADNHDAVEDGDNTQAVLARRAAAYQAYYEHLPLPRDARPHGASMRIHRNLDYGSLARLHLLDTRQYRDRQQICGTSSVTGPACTALDAEQRSMLGAQQERWLRHSLGSSHANWNAITQTVLFAPYNFRSANGADEDVYYASWQGYPAARARLLDDIVTQRPHNPLMLSGDWHTAWVNTVDADAEARGSRPVMTEFLSSGISSDPGFTSNLAKPSLEANPHVRYYDDHCGYTLCTITRDNWQTTFLGAETTGRDGSVRPVSSWTVESGRPEAERS
ncbi:alkaline phosphatase D family protein [Nonomuraea indica]|uniref:Alkaline phosphatase D family protein n=1 Tax=Nonomuraea indica TaxID=1581193 RepID=A0ABW8A8T3_9ACTN